MRKPIHTVTKEDVGKRLGMFQSFGVVLPRDVGKRVYRTKGGPVVENDEQRAERLEAGTWINWTN